MKRKILVALLISLLTSCQEKKVEINLLTNQLVSKRFSKDSLDLFYKDCKYNNENEKIAFTNIIKFKIANNTDKKYVFFPLIVYKPTTYGSNLTSNKNIPKSGND